MIDCGEGTQLQLSRFGISRNKIKAIFISHFHGDHLYGLPGLLTSYMHFSRQEPLTIVGPIGLKKWLDVTFEISKIHIVFDLKIIETDTSTSAIVFEDQWITAHNFELHHRIPTQGYVLIEKEKDRNILKEKIDEYNLGVQEILELKHGNEVLVKGKLISPDMACAPKMKPVKYVFMSDTTPLNEIPEIAYQPDLLYHEATYLHEMADKAIERGHSTSIHAAETAVKIGAQKLVIGHFSNRYTDLSDFEREAKQVFEHTQLAEDGKSFEIRSQPLPLVV